MLEIMLVVAGVFILGIVIGILIMCLVNTNISGSLVEDNSDPESPYLFLELKKNGYDNIRTKKTIKLAVEHRNYVQRK